MAALRALIPALRRALARPEAPAAIDLDAARAERHRENPGAAELPFAQCEAEVASGELSPAVQAALARTARRLARYAPAARRELARRQPAQEPPAAARTAPRARPRERRATAGRRAAAGSPSRSTGGDEPPPPDLAVIPLRAFEAELARALGGRP